MLRHRLGRIAALTLATAFLIAVPSSVRAGDPMIDGVDQAKVEEAIRKGAEFIKSGYTPSDTNANTELVLLTLLHAGVSISDPAVAAGIEYVKRLDVSKLPFKEKTYRLSIAAMCLERVNRDAFVDRLAEFAQFLVDNQCANGQWSYGENIEFTGERTISSGGGEAGTAPPSRGRETRAQKQVPIKPGTPKGPPHGDHSNTQFALLGLRACAEAGVVIPKETWQKSMKILEQGQRTDGGWGYSYPSPLDAGGAKTVDAGASYGSMTCSGVCGLIIARTYLKLDWKKDPAVVKGLDWLANNFTVKENAKMANNPAPNMQGGGAVWHYYYLYGLERAGMMAGTPTFGARKWYKNGAEYLLEKQDDNGSWFGSIGNDLTCDTCFAILFLKRATHPVTIQSGR